MANRPYDAEYEPRPHEWAFREAQRHRAFVDALSRAGLGNARRAEECAVVVLCTLERRITFGEARDLNEELPWALRDRLRVCEGDPRAPPERFGREEFLARVGEALGIDEVEAARVARTVFATVRTLISEKAAADVEAQLPPDIASLWTAPA